MIPTDEQINIAMALACGRTEQTYFMEGHWGETSEIPVYCDHDEDVECTLDDPLGCFLHDYCHDRNALVEVWTEVGNCCVIPEFVRLLNNRIDAFTVWDMLMMPPRAHVISALRALGKWPDDWQVPE